MGARQLKSPDWRLNSEEKGPSRSVDNVHAGGKWYQENSHVYDP